MTQPALPPAAEPPEEATLEDLGLMVSYISQTKNDADYYWTTNGSDAVGITSFDKVVVYGRGETVFTVHASGSTNTPMYFIVHSPYVDDGTYYIRNWGSDRYLEIVGDISDCDIYGNTFAHNSSQQWKITYLGNGEYSIQSAKMLYYYLGINGDVTGQGGLVVPRSGALTSGMRWKITQVDNGGLIFSPQSAPDLSIRTDDSPGGNIRQYTRCDPDSIYFEWLLCEPSQQIVHEDQESDYFCWVACAKMASTKYIKSPISQGSASYYVRFNGEFDARTLYPSFTEGSPALGSGSAVETSQALEYILGWRGSTYYSDSWIYDEDALISLLDWGNVVIAGRQREIIGGHAYLIYDYEYNPYIEKYLFYLYDPSLNSDNTTLLRTYEWICNGQDAYYSNHKDSLVWKWLVTYKIGGYTEHYVAVGK